MHTAHDTHEHEARRADPKTQCGRSRKLKFRGTHGRKSCFGLWKLEQERGGGDRVFHDRRCSPIQRRGVRSIVRDGGPSP